MKKIFSVVVLALLFNIPAFAINNYPDIKAAGDIYKFKFSDCNANSKSCLNEYYKNSESGYNWTELLTFVFVNNFTDFKKYSQTLKDGHKYSSWLERTNNYDILEFLIPFEKDGNLYIEQNVAKISLTNDGKSSVSMQFAQKYRFDEKNKDEIEKRMISARQKYAASLRGMKPANICKEPYQAW